MKLFTIYDLRFTRPGCAHPFSPFPLFSFSLFLLSACTSTAQIRSVSVNTNGSVVAPTNFFPANSNLINAVISHSAQVSYGDLSTNYFGTNGPAGNKVYPTNLVAKAGDVMTGSLSLSGTSKVTVGVGTPGPAALTGYGDGQAAGIHLGTGPLDAAGNLGLWQTNGDGFISFSDTGAGNSLTIQSAAGAYKWFRVRDNGQVEVIVGPLLLPSDPTSALHAATKQYVDAVAPIAGRGIVVSGRTVHFADALGYTSGWIPFATGTSTIGFSDNFTWLADVLTIKGITYWQTAGGAVKAYVNNSGEGFFTDLVAISGTAGKLAVGAAVVDASAKVDIVSTNSGALLPRLTSAQRDSITSPAIGLTVFDLTLTNYAFWNGAAWTPLTSEGATVTNLTVVNLYASNFFATNFFAENTYVSNSYSTNMYFVSGKGNTLIVTQYVRFPYQELTLTGTNVNAVDLSAGTHFKLTLTADAFMPAPSSLPGTNLAQTIQIVVQQDPTGGRTLTWTNSTWKFPGGTAPTQTATANAVDVYSFVSSPFSATQLLGVQTADIR